MIACPSQIIINIAANRIWHSQMVTYSSTDNDQCCC